MNKAFSAVNRLVSNIVDPPAIVLIYHRVTRLELDPQQLAVSPENFSAQLETLRTGYNLLDIEEFKELRLRKKKLPRKSVILTFDDGYADNFLEATPILERYGAQALFYISTSLLGTKRELWWDDIERALLTQPQLPDTLQLTTNDRTYVFRTATREERRQVYDQLHGIIKNSPNEQRVRLQSDIVRWAGIPVDGRATHRMLDMNELVAMAKSPSAVIGAHTHTHPKLSVLTPVEQKNEIATSKQILESTLNRRITHFSYPFGSITDFTNDTVQICKELEFEMVCANIHNQVHSWNDMYTLPRMLVRDWSGEAFAKFLRKVFIY